MKPILWLGLLTSLLYGFCFSAARNQVLSADSAPAAPTATSNSATATLAPASSQNAVTRFAAIGDYGQDHAREAAVATLVASWNPQFVVTTGDNNYNDGAASTIDANIGKYYQQYIFPYTGSFGAGASENRFFPTLGNHDWRGLTVANGAVTGAYLDYFTLPGNERYYDFVKGPVHFFMVDSDDEEPDGVTNDSVQANWLRTQLSQSTAPWQLVLMHHPPYSSGRHGPSTDLQWPYKAWGADLVMTGHDHTYERLLIDGFPYIVNGLGGASLYAFPNVLAGSQVRYNEKHGAVLLSATTMTLTLQAFAVDGGLIDSYAMTQTAVSLEAKAYLPLIH